MNKPYHDRARSKHVFGRRVKMEEEKRRIQLSYSTKNYIKKLGRQKESGGWQSLINDIHGMLTRVGNIHACIYLTEPQIDRIVKYSESCSVPPLRKAYSLMKTEMK